MNVTLYISKQCQAFLHEKFFYLNYIFSFYMVNSLIFVITLKLSKVMQFCDNVLYNILKGN